MDRLQRLRYQIAYQKCLCEESVKDGDDNTVELRVQDIIDILLDDEGSHSVSFQTEDGRLLQIRVEGGSVITEFVGASKINSFPLDDIKDAVQVFIDIVVSEQTGI